MAGNNLARGAPAFQDTPTHIRKLIAEHLGIEQALLCDSTDFLEDLEADWLDVVELIGAVEAEFGMEFTDEMIDRLKTVGDLIRFVETHDSA
jgi:acyl carrier protein